MNEALKVPEAPLDPGKWIGRVVVAVILGEGIWGLLVSITNNLVLPALTRIMGADPQSPLYLGKGDFNYAALFTSVLQLCFAGIVAVLLYSWARETRRIRTRVVQPAPIAEQPRASVVPVPVASPAIPATPVQPSEPVRPVQTAPPPPQPTPQPSQPPKPKKPKEVYYNIVGEPIESDDE
jgi:large-conductance mechanosensitive channel